MRNGGSLLLREEVSAVNEGPVPVLNDSTRFRDWSLIMEKGERGLRDGMGGGG